MGLAHVTLGDRKVVKNIQESDDDIHITGQTFSQEFIIHLLINLDLLIWQLAGRDAIAGNKLKLLGIFLLILTL